MKIKGFFLFVIMLASIINASLFAMQTIGNPDVNYYSEKHIRSLRQAGVRVHAPCMIIIDKHEDELPTDKGILALPFNLAASIRVEFFPIIVSEGIIYNFIYRSLHLQGPENLENKIFKQSPAALLRSNNWHAYVVPNSDLIVLIPKKFMSLYGKNTGFTLEKLLDVSTFLDNPQVFLTLLEKKKQMGGSSLSVAKTFDLIFKTKTNTDADETLPIWDYILTGHGALDKAIAGLTPSEIQEVLLFFNKKLFTSTLYISSCSAGGKNLDLLTFKRITRPSIGWTTSDNILQVLNYILIVGSATDTPKYPLLSSVHFFRTFFDYAARIGSRGSLLNDLLREINVMQINYGNIHGTSNIPQIWLPGGLGFQTFNIDERIKVLGNVFVQVHKENKQPISINDKTRAILIYPEIIPVPVTLLKPHIINAKPSVILEQLQTASELSTSSGNLNNVLSGPHSSSFPAHNSINFALGQGKSYLYPQFISMGHGSSFHHFTEISIKPVMTRGNEIVPFVGVMHFIRDAFLDIGGRETLKIFAIDSLSGVNDISLLLETARAKKNIVDRNPLEEKLENHSGNIKQLITLNNVLIETQGNSSSLASGNRYTWFIRITFEFAGKAWQFIGSDKSIDNLLYLWNFEEIDLAEYQENYQSNIDNTKDLNQESISDILRKQLLGIQKK